ncbi:MAG: CaiB/BaiF CoA transferase family protein [Solirubrobacterales bacterium]
MSTPPPAESAPGDAVARPIVERDALPLADLQILDLSRLLPGGFCSLLLADLGADVIKVEDTGAGDYVRWAPPYYGGDEHTDLGTRSALYLALNRNKRSIRIDLKHERGRETLLRLAEHADVVLESFRPGVMDRLGVGFEALRERNPALVYCAITGYGQTGSHAARAGHDMNYLALNGMLGQTGAPGGPPVQPAGQIADLGGGASMAAIGILAAVHSARASGRGQMVDISMTDGSLSWLAMVAGRHLAEGSSPARGHQELSGGLACYAVYQAADGFVACGALEPKFWQVLCRGVDREDLIEHQYAPPGSEGREAVAALFAERTRGEWRVFNDTHDCCIEPVLDLDEALGSQLVAEREMVVELDQPQLGPVRQLGTPIRLSETPGGLHRPAPALGEHTAEILAQAGMGDEQIAELTEAGAVVGQGSAATEPFMY